MHPMPSPLPTPDGLNLRRGQNQPDAFCSIDLAEHKIFPKKKEAV